MANVGKDLLQVPFPEMVKAMATGIAEAQLALDMTSLRIAKLMSGADEPDTPPEAKGKNLVTFHNRQYSLLELGFTPTFYQFVDTIIEIKLSISMSEDQAQARSSTSVDSEVGFKAGLGFFSASGSATLKVSTVSASFASKYQYSAEGASLMRTKLVPVPPPPILEQRIRAILEEDVVSRGVAPVAKPAATPSAAPTSAPAAPAAAPAGVR
jgi:hypothetical protein